MMLLALVSIKSRVESIPWTTKLREVIYAYAHLPGIADHSSQKRKAVPNTHVNKSLVIWHPPDSQINDGSDSKRGHSRNFANITETALHFPFSTRKSRINEVKRSLRQLKQPGPSTISPGQYVQPIGCRGCFGADKTKTDVRKKVLVIHCALPQVKFRVPVVWVSGRGPEIEHDNSLDDFARVIRGAIIYDDNLGIWVQLILGSIDYLFEKKGRNYSY